MGTCFVSPEVRDGNIQVSGESFTDWYFHHGALAGRIPLPRWTTFRNSKATLVRLVDWDTGKTGSFRFQEREGDEKKVTVPACRQKCGIGSRP